MPGSPPARPSPRIWRVLGALLLSALFAAALLAGAFALFAAVKLPDHPTPLTVPPALVQRTQAAVTATAEAYGIPAPAVAFEDTSIPGVTFCDKATRHCEIHLGRFALQPYFLDHPEAVVAVAEHEAGHAVQEARGDAGSAALAIGAAFAALWLCLFAWGQGWRSMLAAGVVGFVLLAAILAQRASPIGMPGALMPLMLAAAAVLALDGKGRPARSRLRSALPGLAGCALLLWAGSFNHRHETFSDEVAACQDGRIEPVRDGLVALSADRGAVRIAADLLLDPMHPNSARRLAALDRLRDPGALRATCARLRDPKVPARALGAAGRPAFTKASLAALPAVRAGWVT